MAVVTTNLGTITAYGDAVAAGYTGTKAQWQALMADYATVGSQAAQSAQTASTAATTATTAAQTATTKASEASASATAAAASAASITTPDATLTQAGVAADAKATGDEISDLKEELNDKADATHVKEIEGSSYYTIPADKWEVGDWRNYLSTRDRKYRVRCKETLCFQNDTYVLCDYGYNIVVLYEDGEGVSNNYVAKIKANRNAHIYSRRISENTSEVITDITPFVTAIKFATVFSPINIYAPTFTDVSMFERVGIGGDSYSAGGGIISGIRPLTWGKNLERQAGITVDIYAKSGENVVQWVSDTVNGLPALLAGTECGLYWLWHGMNGTSTAETLGTPEDMSASPHPATFYGQYVEAIEQIKATFPKARIVLATVTGSNYGLYQSQYVNANTAIKAIAEYCSVPCIDIVEDDYYKSFEYSNNIRSVHPTAMVAAGMAMANRRLIAKCILDNPDYFINYGSN